MTLEEKLVANTQVESYLKKYICQNASESLKARILDEKCTKTLASCWEYVVSEARKMLGGKSGALTDAEVFGIAIHYFEEDSIEAPTPVVPARVKIKKETVELGTAEKEEKLKQFQQNSKNDVDAKTVKCAQTDTMADNSKDNPKVDKEITSKKKVPKKAKKEVVENTAEQVSLFDFL